MRYVSGWDDEQPSRAELAAELETPAERRRLQARGRQMLAGIGITRADFLVGIDTNRDEERPF